MVAVSSAVSPNSFTSPRSFNCSRSAACAIAFVSGSSIYICISDILVMICSIWKWSEFTCSFWSTVVAVSEILPIIDVMRAMGWRKSSLAAFSSSRWRVSSLITSFFFVHM